MINNFIVNNNEINNEIFIKMENKKWNDIIKIINDDKNNTIDYNVKNNSNVCLLEYLILNQNNFIKKISINIKKLVNLQNLSVAVNLITKLPNNIIYLKKIKYINYSYNKINNDFTERIKKINKIYDKNLMYVE
jgi:hypothetical protein